MHSTRLNHITKKIEKHQRTKEKKLLRLCADIPADTLNPDDVIFNFSSRNLTTEEKNILARGLNFAIHQ